MIKTLSKSNLPLFYPQTNSLSKKIGKYERDLRIDLIIKNQLIEEKNLNLKIYLEDLSLFGYFNRELKNENKDDEYFECFGSFRIDLYGDNIKKLYNRNSIGFNCELKIIIPVKYDSISKVTDIKINSFYNEVNFNIDEFKIKFEEQIKEILNNVQTIGVEVIKII